MNRAMADELFALLRYALATDEQDTPPQVSQRVSDYIAQENLVPFFSSPNRCIETLSEGSQTCMKRAIYQKTLLLTVGQIMTCAREECIPVAQLKGEVLRDCYPEGILRTSSDVDLFVPPDFAKEFERFMESMGAQKKCDIDSLQIGVADYFFPNGVHVEAHYIIGIQLDERQRQFMRKAGMFSQETFTTCSCSDVEITTLDPTFHLVYLIYHFAKHLMFWEGSTVRMLVDIGLFARKYVNEIDPQRLKTLIEGLGYALITDAIFEVIDRFLGIPCKIWIPSQTGLSYKLLRMVPEKIGSYQSFRERLAWSTYHVDFVRTEDGLMDSKLVFRPLLFAAFLPFSLHWAWRRSSWQLETDYKSRSWRF